MKLFQLALIFSLQILVTGTGVQADPKKEIGDLNQRYITLRNIDPSIRRKNDWIRMGEELRNNARTYSKNEYAVSPMYNSAIVYEQLYQTFGEKKYLKQAIGSLEEIIDSFPRSDLLDDALLRLGDLYWYELESSRKAKKVYSRLVEDLPQSDLFDIAKLRLKEIADSESVEKTQYDPFLLSEFEQNLIQNGKPLIVIDPGHGGEDLGAVGPEMLLEKDVVLSIGLQLADKLRADNRSVVRLTRLRDEFVPLAERTEVANRLKADLFISLHVNASVRKNLSGFEIYYLDNAQDKASKTLADRENASVKYEGVEADLKYMLSDLIQYGKRTESLELAASIRKNFNNILKPKYSGVLDLGIKRAPFYVLVGAHMPCILVEMFFVDHKIDGYRLAQDTFRKDLSSALERGVLEFLKSYTTKS